MKDSYYTVVELKAQEGRFEELIQLLKELAEPTRKEEGCQEYFFIKDQTKKRTVLSIEKWDSGEDENSHWQTIHLKNAVKQLENILESDPLIYKGPKIHII